MSVHAIHHFLLCSLPTDKIAGAPSDEGLPGCDLDPIHVSDYHMQPYLQFWPSVAKNTLYTGWAQV
eukprot:SAG22_NODE_410_length_10907_cov_2.597520_4_plen_66_part_00